MADPLARLRGALADRYAIERELGAGGMATVYLARDLRHERAVAIKVLRPELAASLGAERFLREIKTTAQLTHPNILPLLDSGDAGGLLYYAMPFVEGESLRGRLKREKQLPVDDALRIAREVADALGYAHSHGVIHRDIKPENVLLESGHAVVADFGIARAVRAAGGERLTETGFTVGTPEYMSPEQAAGSEDVDGRSDVYSLGCVLYEMLSAETPYTGPTPVAILAKKLSEPLPRISVVRETVPPAVEAALAKALARIPADRFATAGEFAAALSGEGFVPAVAPRAGKGRRLLLVSAAAAVLVGAGVYALLRWMPGGARGSALVNASFTQLTTEPGVEWFPSLSPDGKWVVYGGDAGGHRHIFLRGVGAQNPFDLTKDSPGDDDQPAFSPDGERIAFRSSREGGGIFVMGRTGEGVRRATHAGFRPTWSPDGTQLAYASQNVEFFSPNSIVGQQELWIADVTTGASHRVSTEDAALPSWSPHGYRIAYTKRLSAPRHQVRADVWTMTPRGQDPVAVTNDLATDLYPAWSPDGRYLYFASDRGGSMNLWRVRIDEKSGKVQGSPEPITTPTTAMAQISLAGDGRSIAYSSVPVTQNIQTATLDPVTATVIGDPTWVTTGSVRWSSPDPSPDGQWVAFYSLDHPEGHVYVARADGTELRQVTGDTALDRVPRWSPDGKWLAFFSNRGGIYQLWKIRSDASELTQLTDAQAGMVYPVWSPDGSRLAGLVADTTYIMDPNRPWAQQAAQELPKPDAALSPYYMNSWSPDGRWICGGIGPADRGILTYDLRAHRYERLTDFGEWPVWLPDSRHILFVSGRGKAFYIVDRGTKQVKKIYTGGRDTLGPPRLSRDGRHIFYSRRLTEADIWLMTVQ
jgi:Tol biopolymer transport system component